MFAKAISNNDVALVSWRYDDKIKNCLGFAVYRVDANGQETPLPAWVGFQGGSNTQWQAHTTEEWPVQKYSWRDLTAPRGRQVRYKIVPRIGTPGQLQSDEDLAQVTAPVTLTPKRGDFQAFFNRGILATQSLAHALPKSSSGVPNFARLKDRIDQPGDPLRDRLSAELRTAVLGLFDRAKADGGEMFAALYELTDPELEQRLLGSNGVHLVLSNTGADDEENQPARQALHSAGLDITDRFVASNHIGHNKFVVITNRQGNPAAVWTGSTNWTQTGLCTQSNNGLLIESPSLAGHYMDYWNRLQTDTTDASEPKDTQSAEFRQANNRRFSAVADGGDTEIGLWFSPNTEQKSKPKGADTPSDLDEVFQLIHGAQQAVFFLVFQPGSPSIVEETAAAEKDNGGLLVYGAATDPGAVNSFETELFHRTATKPDKTVVAASAVKDQFAYWQKELLKMGPQAHAIIHDKIVVIDPFSEKPTVITGSHNLGFRASFNNDENLLIIRGNRPLAAAYATHVLDIYQHYRWRATLEEQGDKAFSGLEKNDGWQDKYFKPTDLSEKEFRFWQSA